MYKNLLSLFLLLFLFNCKSSPIDPNPAPAVVTNNVRVAWLSAYKKPRPETIVILGSSTAEGWGASSYKYSWAGLLTEHVVLGRVINLAKAGYTSYQILPTGTNPTPGRPLPDTLRNITAALKKKPTTLIISITTNDVANGFSVAELIKNFNTVQLKAVASGVKRVIITTSHPRQINASTTANYMLQRDEVLKTYGKFAVNFFDPVADSNNLFKTELLCGDGIHPNDKGHSVLFEQIQKTLGY